MADETVRHFQLRNSEDNTMDLLELHHFAYSPTGLGVEMSNTYFPSYGSFLPETLGIKQNVIKLSILYGYGTNKPYKDYRDLINFINKTPLTLAYAYPDSEEDGFYTRDVVVQSITKGEVDNSVGYLKSDLSFEALTPWYQYVSYAQRGGSSKPLKPGKMYAGDANSYVYPYTYQTNPSAPSKSLILNNDSVYLGYQPDSALVVTVTATQGTGVISNPGWILYDTKNRFIQQERILIDIPIGSTLRVNSDYKDREVTLIEGDVDQTTTDIADHIDPRVRGFVRVPLGTYRLQLDDTTFSQIGGFNLGSIRVLLKKEWLVV